METFRFKKLPAPDLSKLTIDGDRLYLRSIEAGQAQEIFREFTSEITRYMFPKPPDTIDEVFAFISESQTGMKEGWDLVLSIIEKEKHEFLGLCGFHGKGKVSTPELGIWLKKSAHGKKYGREAIRTVVTWAAQNVEVEYLTYPVDRANVSSRKIPESLGGVVFEGKITKTRHGSLLDEVVYRILI
jgi:RimJ/RimL family protein N-acetyltransferase